MHVRIDWRGGWLRASLAGFAMMLVALNAPAAEAQKVDARKGSIARAPGAPPEMPPVVSEIAEGLKQRAEAIALFADDATIDRAERALDASAHRIASTSELALDDATRRSPR